MNHISFVIVMKTNKEMSTLQKMVNNGLEPHTWV